MKADLEIKSPRVAIATDSQTTIKGSELVQCEGGKESCLEKIQNTESKINVTLMATETLRTEPT